MTMALCEGLKILTGNTTLEASGRQWGDTSASQRTTEIARNPQKLRCSVR